MKRIASLLSMLLSVVVAGGQNSAISADLQNGRDTTVAAVGRTAPAVSGIAALNYGNNHFTNGFFALEGKAAKVIWRADGSIRYEDDILDGSLFRRYESTGGGITQQITTEKVFFNSDLGAGVTLLPDRKNTVSVDVKLLLPKTNTKRSFSNTYFESGHSAGSISASEINSIAGEVENRTNDITLKKRNLDLSTSWRHIMTPEFSEYTIGATLSRTLESRPSNYSLEGREIAKSDSDGSTLVSTLQGDFKFNYTSGTLDFGAKMTYRGNNQNSDFYTRTGRGWELYSQYSTDLFHQVVVPAAYALFSSHSGKHFSYKAGLRSEYSIVTIRSLKGGYDITKGDWFIAPTLSGEYKISPAQALSLEFTRRISYPTYPQLNPFMSMIDANTFEQGNARLRPEKRDILNLAYSAKSSRISLLTGLYLNRTKGYITQVSKINDDGNLILTYINSNSHLNSGLDLTLKLSPARWFDATLSANTFYTDTRGVLDEMTIDNRGWSNISDILVKFLPAKSTDIHLQYFILTPQYYPQFTTEFNHYMNIGIKQSLCKGALTVSATAVDIFNTDKWDIRYSNSLYTIHNYSHLKSRMVWIGVTYNFNSFKPKKAANGGPENRSRLNLGL